MSEPTRATVAKVLAEDVAGGNTLRADNFDDTADTTVGSLYQELAGVYFYVSFRVNGHERTFKVTVTNA